LATITFTLWGVLAATDELVDDEVTEVVEVVAWVVDVADARAGPPPPGLL
jgi:hypothetical protein